MDDLIFLLIVIVVVIALIFLIRSRQQTSGASSSGSAASVKAPTASEKQQMVQDIKATKTSTVEDAVSILNDLASTQSTYRHYCELVGTSMASGGVKAPYSQREVAYYSVRCYRIENVNGRDYETLVAQEASVDPFYFTDSSGDTRVYVNLESFGPNVILLNSANHIEGPNSDFSKAFKTQTSAGSRIGAAATACMGLAAQKLGNVVAGGRAVAGDLRAVLEGLRSNLLPRRRAAYAGMGGLAFAGAYGCGIDASPSLRGMGAIRHGGNVMFAGPGGPGGGRGGMGGPGGRPGGMGGRPYGGSQRPPQQRPGQGRSSQGNVNDLFGSSLGGLGSFLGSGGGYNSGMPTAFGGSYGRGSSSSSSADLGGMLLGMGLGALLNSVTTSSTTQASTGGQQDSFRGYRIVEDIVPLSSPIYCIGEIYKAGDQVYMGASVAEGYTTSYFATKAETEVIAALAAK